MRSSMWRALLVPLVATMLALTGLLLPGARGVPAVAAATVSVPCDTAQLIAVVGNTANDVLNLAAGCIYTLTASNNDTDKPNGLPNIARTLTIYGNGAIIERSSAEGTPNFRLFHVAAAGNLTLDNLTVRNGRTPSGGNAWFGGGAGAGAPGGGIYAAGGLMLTNVTVSGNATGGGGPSGAGIQSSPLTATIAANGQASAPATANGTAGGPYTVTASAPGATATVPFSLTNLTIPTTLVAADASGTYGGTVNLSAKLTATSGGANVSGKSIAFTLNGSSVGHATTNASGVASLSSFGLGAIGANTYTTGVGASFAGDSTHTATSDTAQLTVAKAATTTSARGEATYGDTTATLTATVTRTSNGQPVPAGGRITFTMNGQTYQGTNNAQGVATATAPLPRGQAAGTFAGRVQASYAGASGTLPSSGSGALTVARRVLWVKPADQTVGLRQPNPTSCTLDLANGSTFAPGDTWATLNLTALRCQYNRNPPAANASETVGKTYRITAFGAASTNYDIRYAQGTLTVR